PWSRVPRPRQRGEAHQGPPDLRRTRNEVLSTGDDALFRNARLRLLVSACAAQDARESEVALVARVLVNLLAGPQERDHRAPRTRPRRVVGYRKGVFEAIGADTREAFDQVQVLMRPAEVALRR